MRKEIAAKDRALGGAHSWRGVGAGREGMREERGVAPPSPSFPVPPASAMPPCPEAKLVNAAPLAYPFLLCDLRKDRPPRVHSRRLTFPGEHS